MIAASYNFEYTGEFKEFTLVPGIYSFKIAGSNGAANSIPGFASGGNGAVISAELVLKKMTTFYAYVGGRTVFNGGGKGQFASGSASDVRLVSGEWHSFESLKSRVIVAGGGGGTDSDDKGGDGGLNGYPSAQKRGKGGTQTLGGDGLSQGGFGFGGEISKDSGGGGSGYYGGGSSDSTVDYGGGGGSSFVSGYKECNAISESSTITNITHTGSPVHYSRIKFTNVVVEDGANAGTGYINVKFLRPLNIEFTCRCNKGRNILIPFASLLLLYSI